VCIPGDTNTGRTLAATSPTMPVLETEGALIGDRYILGPKLGAGGLGLVRHATDRILGRPVAIKCMHPALRRSAHDIRRVHREAVVAASFTHPNVCATLDAGMLADGSPFVVLERLEGIAVDARIEQGPIPVLEALDIAIQALAGLAAAHAAGILHRDVKPGNVLLVETERGERPLVKLIDFGSAQSLEAHEITPAGTTVGTPHYLAPEQTTGTQNLDQRVDVYGVGVLLYEMLSGQRAFEAERYSELLQKVANGHVDSLGTICPGLPACVVGAVHRAMATQREFRFSTARDFLDALVAIHESMSRARYVPPWALVAAPAYVRTGSGEYRSVSESQIAHRANPITQTMTVQSASFSAAKLQATPT
jgi:eukaryotic-like serine/threonine-protein kinase